MVPFGGWDMPVQYTGIIDEHRTVRGAVGLFDISHMGEFEVRGPDALAAVQRLCTNDASTLAIGQVQYAALCYPEGGIVDDLTVYRLAADHFMLVVNASNIEKDWAWVTSHSEGRAEWTNVSDETALLAVQGPRAEALVARLADRDVTGLGYYHFARGAVAGVAGPHLPHRLHRRGRLRAVRAGRPGRAALVGAARGGTRRRHQADRARGPRHAPARDEVRALRQRHRPDHQSARGRARLGGEAGQGRVHRARAPSRRCARGASAASWWGSRWPSARCRGTATACWRTARRSAWSPPARSARRSSARSAWATWRRPQTAVGTALTVEIRGALHAARVVKTPFHPSHTKKA